MQHIAEQIRTFAWRIAASGYQLHEIKIFFSAPDPRDPSARALAENKAGEFEGNFQWISYALMFHDSADNWYVYVTPLNAWGTRKDGGQRILVSDIKWTNKRQDADGKEGRARIDPQDVEKAFPKELKDPNLYPSKAIYVNVGPLKESQGTELNFDLKNKKEYPAEQFEQLFSDKFYVVVNIKHELVNPLAGKPGSKPAVPQGTQGSPKEEEKA